jgi:putative endonuclease
MIYVGQTDDFDRRFKEHNGEGDFKSWASRYAPWVLFYSEDYQTRSEAVKREKYLKTGAGRAFLRNVLAGWSPPKAK